MTRRWRGTWSSSKRAMLAGTLIAIVGTAAVSALSPITSLEGKPGPAPMYLLVVLVAASLGGVAVGLLASIVAFLAYGFFFLEPVHSFGVHQSNLLALGSFLVANVVGTALLARAQRASDSHETARRQVEEAWAQTNRLQAVTAALSEAVTSEEVAAVIVREGMVAFRAHRAAVLVVAKDGSLECVASTGFEDGLVHVEIAEDAVLSRRVTSLESGDGSTVAVPLLVEDKPIGALHLTVRSSGPIDGQTINYYTTIARLCAQALRRAQLHEAEAAAREQAEKLTSRLRRLQGIVDATLEGGTVDELLERILVRLREAVGSDTATILVLDESGTMLRERAAIGFAEPVEARVPVGQGFAGRIAATQHHEVVVDISTIEIVSPYLRRSGIVSLAGVPLVNEGRTVGVLHVGTRSPHGFEREDVLVLRLAGSRIAAALERAQAQEQEQEIAATLQRSLLPSRLPDVTGLEVAARYLPATAGMTVGGDWYDVFELFDGSVGFAVGDVVGHGVGAAAAMGRLRDVLRAYANDGLGPADALSRLNLVSCRESEDIFATVVYVVVDESRTRLTMSSAGHPPPLLRGPDLTVRRLEEGRSSPIGANIDAVYRDVEVALEPDSLLVLYTDGLVERRDESIDVGIDRLAAGIAKSDSPVADSVDAIIEAAESARHDDIVALAIAIEAVTQPRLSLHLPPDARALGPMRASLRAWLGEVDAQTDEIFDIVVAANEACTNAIEHPYLNGNAATAVIDLDAEIVNGEVSIIIRGPGAWRHGASQEDRGRGLQFMQALMEGVDVTRLPDGTTVHLHRRLRGKGAS